MKRVIVGWDVREIQAPPVESDFAAGDSSAKE